MKRVSAAFMFCFLLALMAGGSAVFAEEEDVLDVPEMGFHYELPDAYRELKGSIFWGAGDLDDGIREISCQYFAFPEDRMDAYVDYSHQYMDAIENGEEPREAEDPSWGTGYEWSYLFNLYEIDGNRGEEDLRSVLREYNAIRQDNFTWLEEIGKEGDTTFFLGQYAKIEEDKEKYRETMGEYYDEFVRLYTDKETFLSGLAISEPVWPEELTVGDSISFETTDLDGNPVSGTEIFAGHEVTMINVWATWCGPCVNEMPELAKLAEEFEERGCQIVGICHDAGEEGMAEEAKTILEETGASYLNLIAPADVDDVFRITAFPTSYFVDSEGKLLADPVVGAYVDVYSGTLDEVLAAAE